MGCECEFEGVDVWDCGPEFINQGIRKARKEHKCCECGETIPPGTEYEYVSGCWTGDFLVFKTCLDCESLRSNLLCSWTYGDLYEILHEELHNSFGKVGGECVAALTEGAREKLLEMLDEMYESGSLKES